MEKYLPQLLAEKDALDPSFTHALRMVTEDQLKPSHAPSKTDSHPEEGLNAGTLDRAQDPSETQQPPLIKHAAKMLLTLLDSITEIEKIQKGEESDDGNEDQYIDVVINKNMKLAQKVLIPIKQFPKDYNDEIRQAQLQELTYLNGGSENAEVPVVRGKPAVRSRGAPVAALSRARGGVPPLSAGVPRGAPAPRGVTPARVPSTRARGLLATRTRGIPHPAGYRPPPPAQDTYGEYDYDDGYGTAYDDPSYDSYDNSYNSQVQSTGDYYDYGHGLGEESYDSYGQDDWANSRHKAITSRATKGAYRDQPYARY
ncbi:KH domain-containing, RNA-binding, signal transduction-associated protein 3 isoform X3 [Eleutherodactylus coqui]|uniref:KH domain-containing, RNA-binding, signal transduction-associated protein 3 isoform X3 n=1 Tax=Eleutherodactylus coqui TaxID=57060 RepID=UPI0034617D9C